jgi:hypothetical protein
MPAPVGNFIIKALINSPLHPLLGEIFSVIPLAELRTGIPVTMPNQTISVAREIPQK